MAFWLRKVWDWPKPSRRADEQYVASPVPFLSLLPFIFTIVHPSSFFFVTYIFLFLV